MTATAIPEQGTYDATVYMLQISDPVEGYNPANPDTPANVGVSNQPILNLANRTGWLYGQINNILNGTTVPSGVATLLSPTFTGSPAAPTPALGDSTGKLSTTAFVQGTLAGVLSLSVAGGNNVSLSAVQAGNGTLNFTGALTANIAVIVPSAPGKWIVSNGTSGAFTLTVKTAAGTGVSVTQGKNVEVYGDGTNVYLATNDFASVQLTGTPTAPNPPVGDQTTKVATTEFVYTLKNGVVTVPVGGGVNVTLTPAQYGNGILLLTGALTAAIEVILPAQGGTYVIANETTGSFGLTMGCGGAGKTATIPQGQSVIVYCDGTNTVLAGAAASSSFALHTFTATAGQTDFACSYTPGNIMVIQDGSVLGSANYTATDGANVILNAGAPVGDEIQVIAFSSFTVANAVTVSGATMIGALQLAGGDTGVTPAPGDNSTKLATTAFVAAYALANAAPSLQSISASVASSALTLGFTPSGALQFRNTSLTSGTPVSASFASALSLTVPSGATLGTTSAVQSELVLLVAYDGGSPVLCVANIAGGLNFDETTLISPTTISSGATSASTIYSASAVAAGSPFRVVGSVTSTQAIAGTWATAPTLVQGAGGQAFTSLQSLGMGQTWQDFSGSRAANTTYTNTTGRPIVVSIMTGGTPMSGGYYLMVNGVRAAQMPYSGSNPPAGSMSAIVPPGATYSVTSGTPVTYWSELR